jgi:hypothetical protein
MEDDLLAINQQVLFGNMLWIVPVLHQSYCTKRHGASVIQETMGCLLMKGFTFLGQPFGKDTQHTLRKH